VGALDGSFESRGIERRGSDGHGERHGCRSNDGGRVVRRNTDGTSGARGERIVMMTARDHGHEQERSEDETSHPSGDVPAGGHCHAYTGASADCQRNK
jgi:hypothetical protein